MTILTLAQASVIVDQALERGRALKLAPLTVVVLDGGGHLKAAKREDGSSLLREDIATGKAWGVLGMGFGGRELARRAAKAPPGFFGALFWLRVMSVPDLSSLTSNTYLWPGFTDHWPSAGPGFDEVFSPMAAWGIPAINTLLLLSSGVTVTIAHWALKENKRTLLNLFLFFTIALGALFLSLQAYEYSHAPFAFKGSIYGSTFFMATGFHGFHVIIGTIFLIVCLLRAFAGQFTPKRHLGFEFAAWYWHFVDVVWLFLFSCIYVWGSWGAAIEQ